MLLEFLENAAFLLLGITLVFVLFMMRHFLHWKRKGINFIIPYPLVGNMLQICQLKESIGEFGVRIYKNCKDRYLGLFFFDSPVLFVKDLDLIKEIIIKRADIFPHRTIANDVQADPMGSNNLFVMHAPNCVVVRKKLTPCFTSGKIRSSFSSTVNNCEKLINYIDKKLEHTDEIDAEHFSSIFVINSVVETFFGMDAEAFSNEKSGFTLLLKENAAGFDWKRDIERNAFIIFPDLAKFLRFKFWPESARQFIANLFNYAKEERAAQNISRKDLLDTIIEATSNENTKHLGNDRWLGQIGGILFAAYETSTISLTFSLYELAKNPDVQEKVRREVLDAKNKFGNLDYDCIKSLEYLHKVFQEVLRLHPPLPYLERKSVKKYQIPETDIILDKNTSIFVPVMGMHLDPELFPDPKKFDPERFSKENEQNRHPCSYLPFGDGFRSCIGRFFAIFALKATLAMLMTKYQVSLCDRTKIVLDPTHFLLQFKEPCFLKFSSLKTD